MNQFEERLIAMEEKFSHQDDLLNKLNIVIANQEFKIDALIEQLRELQEAKGQAGSGLTLDTLKDEKPPHY